MRCVPPSSPRSEHDPLLLVFLTSCLVCGLAVLHETRKGVPERGEVGHEGLKRPAIQRPDIDVARDGNLTSLYREAAGDLPPPALDAAILAAAQN